LCVILPGFFVPICKVILVTNYTNFTSVLIFKNKIYPYKVLENLQGFGCTNRENTNLQGFKYLVGFIYQ